MPREHTFTLPSGVTCTVRNFIGSDYDILTHPGYQKKGTQFMHLAKACTLQVGNTKNPTEEFITNMLSNDRKMLLLEARQHTMHHQKTFKFNYEWPMENNRKDLQQYEVEFTPQSFPFTPYQWVRETMEDNGEHGEKLDPLSYAFPVMYEDYGGMLDEQEERFTMIEDEKVYWKILNGRSEKVNMDKARKNPSPNLMITMRDPHYKRQLENNPVNVPFDINNCDVFSLERLRGDIIDAEGEINTYLVIRNNDNDSRQVRVDLLTTDSFFFPSLAR